MGIIGYKAFDRDLKCRDFQYEVGHTYEFDGEPILCKQGFHFCKSISDTYIFYNMNESTRICKVEAVGDISTDDDEIKYCTNKIKICEEIKDWKRKGNTNSSSNGYCNTGDYNVGNRNSGDYNTGNQNAGDYNTGYYNIGNRNTGDWNTGNYNTGSSNACDYNTGNRNTGYYNTGNKNSGNRNSGDYNTGNRNTGLCNTGNLNSGD